MQGNDFNPNRFFLKYISKEQNIFLKYEDTHVYLFVFS
jgi:hypothetical protein